MRRSQAAPEPRTITPEKPHFQASSSDDHADVDVALLEDAVAGQQLFEIVADFQERIAECADVVDQFRRQVLTHAAGAKVGRMHARARRALVEDHQLFALLEAPQRRGERADVHRLRGDVQEMREQPPDLAVKHADELRAARHLEPEQLFRREAERMLLVHRRDIVEPVEYGIACR